MCLAYATRRCRPVAIGLCISAEHPCNLKWTYLLLIAALWVSVPCIDVWSDPCDVRDLLLQSFRSTMLDVVCSGGRATAGAKTCPCDGASSFRSPPSVIRNQGPFRTVLPPSFGPSLSNCPATTLLPLPDPTFPRISATPAACRDSTRWGSCRLDSMYARPMADVYNARSSEDALACPLADAHGVVSCENRPSSPSGGHGRVILMMMEAGWQGSRESTVMARVRDSGLQRALRHSSLAGVYHRRLGRC